MMQSLAARLGQGARALRHRTLQEVVRRSGPRIDDTPVEGGRAAHPLAEPDLAAAPLGEPDGSLRDAALLAGRGDPSGLVRALADLGLPATPRVDLVALRLVHLAAVHAWAQADGPSSARISGAARAHAAWLLRERPVEARDPDATLGAAALLIAARAFPAWPESRDWSAKALHLLDDASAALLGPDGAPLASLPATERALWALALARCWADRTDLGLPARVEGALLRGALCLRRLAGDTGPLPEDGPPVPALLPLSAAPLPALLHDLVVQLGMDEGPPLLGPDPALVRLLGRPLPAAPVRPSLGPDGGWTLWPWRGSDMAVAHSRFRGLPLRGWFRGADGVLRWELDGAPMVEGRRGPLRVALARVDHPQARLVALPPGVDPQQDERPQRDITWRQARLIVLDRGVAEVEWSLGPRWSWQEGEPGEWTGRSGERSMVVRLDGEGWSARRDGARLIARGPETAAVRSIFELR